MLSATVGTTWVKPRLKSEGKTKIFTIFGDLEHAQSSSASPGCSHPRHQSILKPREPPKPYLSYDKDNIAHEKKGQGAFQLQLCTDGDAAPPPLGYLHPRKQPNTALSTAPTQPHDQQQDLLCLVPELCSSIPAQLGDRPAGT